MDPLFTLLTTNIGISVVGRWGESVYNVAHNWLYDASSYYKCIPAENDKMTLAIITWLFYNSHQIKGKGVIIWRYKYDENYEINIQLPPFNKEYPIKTKHGIIYVKIISHINGKINAIELIVDEPWFGKKRIDKAQNLLNYYIYMFSCMSGCFNVSGELRDVYEPEIIYENDICKRHIDKFLWDKMVKINSNILEKKDEYVIYPDMILNKKHQDEETNATIISGMACAADQVSHDNYSIDAASVNEAGVVDLSNESSITDTNMLG